MNRSDSQQSPVLKYGKYLLLFLLAAAIIWGTFRFFPLIERLGDESFRQEFGAWVQSLGIKGWFLVLLIQIGQIILAFVPGEPVEIIAGMLYGTAGGLITCEIGILVGTFLIYYGVRWLGKPFIELFISREELSSYRFLNNTEKLEQLTFLLFFIPGTPKDALTYLVPLTSLKPSVFLSISLLARIPSVLTSTFAGANLSQGNWSVTLLTFAVTGLIGLVGIRYHKKLLHRLNSAHQEPRNP